MYIYSIPSYYLLLSSRLHNVYVPLRARLDDLRIFLETEAWELCPVRASFTVHRLRVRRQSGCMRRRVTILLMISRSFASCGGSPLHQCVHRSQLHPRRNQVDNLFILCVPGIFCLYFSLDFLPLCFFTLYHFHFPFFCPSLSSSVQIRVCFLE